MNIITEILRYGGPTAAISIVGYLILREVFKYLKGRDESFVEIISNHIRHNTESTNRLQQTIVELIRWLKNNNNKR